MPVDLQQLLEYDILKAMFSSVTTSEVIYYAHTCTNLPSVCDHLREAVQLWPGVRQLKITLCKISDLPKIFQKLKSSEIKYI